MPSNTPSNTCPFCSTKKVAYGEAGAEFCSTRSRCPRCRQWSEADVTISESAVQVSKPTITEPAPPGAPMLRRPGRRR